MNEEAKRCVESCREWYQAFSNFGKGDESSVKELLVVANMIESLSEQLKQTEDRLSELLYYVTGGRFSRSDYDTDDMRRFVDDYNQSVCDECDKCEELEQVTRERDAAVEDLRNGACSTCAFQSPCIVTGCVGDMGEACKQCPCLDCANGRNWQWRGVEVEEC